MSCIIGIDPGPETSGVIVGETGFPIRVWAACGQIENYQILTELGEGRLLGMSIPNTATMVIEKVASYGAPVGETVFETVFWSGRFAEAFERGGGSIHRLTQTQVRLALCHTTRAKEAQVKQALRDLYPATGGGKTPQVGTKNEPGPLRLLHGGGDHVYDALAVATAYLLKKQRGEL